MGGTRISPSDAFAYYVSLGAQRSYAAVAACFGVSKTAITGLATREGWIQRLQAIEEAARERSDAELVETLAEMRTRHMRTLRAVHGRAVAGLKDHPIKSAMDAVRALETVIKLERLVAGEPSSHSVVSVPELQQREQDMLVVNGEEEEERDGDVTGSSASVA